jgi:hypothetical protein
LFFPPPTAPKPRKAVVDTVLANMTQLNMLGMESHRARVHHPYNQRYLVICVVALSQFCFGVVRTSCERVRSNEHAVFTHKQSLCIGQAYHEVLHGLVLSEPDCRPSCVSGRSHQSSTFQPFVRERGGRHVWFEAWETICMC